MSALSRVSLVELMEKDSPVDYTLVYTPMETWLPWTAFIDRQLAHVDIWRKLDDGYWLTLRPYNDFLTFDLIEGEPVGTLQQVHCRRIRGTPLWPFGLKTCVTVVKAVLGLRAAWVLTPRQLYDHIEERNRIL